MDQLVEIASNPTLIILIACWEVLWTLTGLWYSARKDKYWFLAIGLIQLLGTIEIFYLLTRTSFYSDAKAFCKKWCSR
ncbi:hypothetical protein HN615_05275 [Candidatus Woesearchaeota archaeon]|jgi:hypothetical protein|nr:hypothetical protein [Candidatus Woesearchaeota archaeon]